ncbi:MAG: excisionase family DNA-binding protein [Betaproteobacteria bacterium]|nr:excisionase family DNA-binding protein [Betaproteobacteria bacterium]
MSSDYQNREYLSVGEVAAYTGLAVRKIHALTKTGEMAAFKSAGGQYRFRLGEIKKFRKNGGAVKNPAAQTIRKNGATQKIIQGDARNLSAVKNESAHLAITSPPYFNAKMYSEKQNGDLGNLHDLDEWLFETGKVWAEVFRILQPGRKFFLNIMNLPVRENKSFRALNLTGKSADMCEAAGFIFKRDIVWHKTNGVRAHFGTYPNPGGILINNMHEFILEFAKPDGKPGKKYAHVNAKQREESKLDKEFWLSLKNSDVWLLKPEKSGGNREHAAPFPLELPARLIRAYSYVGETVFDPFAGSGTTLAAAAQWKRNGIGADINAGFCQMAAKRIRETLV